MFCWSFLIFIVWAKGEAFALRRIPFAAYPNSNGIRARIRLHTRLRVQIHICTRMPLLCEEAAGGGKKQINTYRYGDGNGTRNEARDGNHDGHRYVSSGFENKQNVL